MTFKYKVDLNIVTEAFLFMNIITFIMFITHIHTPKVKFYHYIIILQVIMVSSTYGWRLLVIIKHR